MKKLLGYIKQSVVDKNSALVLLLGLCPLLMMSSSLLTGLVSGAAAMLVLVLSGVVISLLGRVIPNGIKDVSYMVITAFFVAICELLLFAFLPSLRTALGIYLPLITVSGLAFAAAERADNATVGAAALGGLSLGLGYFAVIFIMSFIRELFGNGTLFGFRIIPEEYAIRLITTPFGALFLFGIFVAVFRAVALRSEKGEVEK